jgi:hypothetical protein
MRKLTKIIVIIISFAFIGLFVYALFNSTPEYQKINIKEKDKNITIPRGYKFFKSNDSFQYSKGECFDDHNEKQEIFLYLSKPEDNSINYLKLLEKSKICFDTNDKGISSIYLNKDAKETLTYEEMISFIKNVSIFARERIIKDEGLGVTQNMSKEEILKTYN